MCACASFDRLRTLLRGGSLALATAALLPFAAAQADEPLRLDTAQLDSVTAAAAAGFAFSGNASAFGTISSQSITNFSANSSANQVNAIAGGGYTAFAIGLGGAATANTSTQLDAIEGDIQYVKPYNASGSGNGYAWSYSALYVYTFSSEWL